MVKILEMEGKLVLIDGKTTDDFLKRSTTHKSHEYHAKFHYEFIKNHSINEHTKKTDYEEIKSSQNRNYGLKFIPRD